MYSFEHKDTEHHMRAMRDILEDTAHRAKDCLEYLLDETCWDSQDLDDVKDCIEILCGIRKFNYIGVLGGILGGNCCNRGVSGLAEAQYISDLQAKVQGLEAEMKSFGLVNDQNQLDIELARGFINSAFDKSGIVPLFGFNFDKTDGEALIGILEKYKDS